MHSSEHQFEIGVFVFIRNSSDEVLLVRDATREQRWTLPGGGLNFQELLPDAACRESYEELGVSIVVDRLAGIFSQRKRPGIVALFDAHIISGIPVPDGIETAECAYFSLDAIMQLAEQIKPAQHSMIFQRSSASLSDIVFNFF